MFGGFARSSGRSVNIDDVEIVIVSIDGDPEGFSAVMQSWQTECGKF